MLQERNLRSTLLTHIVESPNTISFQFGPDTYLYDRTENKFHTGPSENIMALRAERDKLTYVPGFEAASAVDKISGKLTSMTLSVTEDCNFGCEYCFFSEIYPDTRNRSDKKMTWETAKKALNIYIRTAKNEAILSFYGGEPTNNWNLIRQCMDYVSEHRPDIQFLAVTNGYRLTELAPEILKYGLNLTISLDGPEEVHNKYRHTRGGIKNTFGKIWDGIQALHILDPEFVKGHVSTNATCWDPADFTRIVDFNLFHDGMFQNQFIGFVGSMGMKEEVLRAHASDYPLADEYIRYGQMYIRAIAEGKEPANILKKMFEKSMQRIFRSTEEPVPELLPLLSACSPGEISLFANEDGSFFICEKLSQGNTLGTVDTGIMREKQEDTLETLAQIRNEVCPTCWLSRMCGVCEASARDETGKMSVRGLRYKCDELKNSNLISIALFSQLLRMDTEGRYYDYFRRNESKNILD